MIPSSVLPMLPSSDDSTIAATRASAASVRACALTFAARISAIIAIVAMNVWSSSSDSFGVYRTKGPRPCSVPQVAITESSATHVAASRRPNRNAATTSGGTRTDSRGQAPGHGGPRPVEGLQSVREPPHEEGAEEPLERVTTADAERRPARPRRRDVHQERAQEQGGPNPVAEQQRRGQRDARRRPHRRRARVDERQRQPELPGEEVDAGEHEEAPRYEGSVEHAYLEVLPRGCWVPGRATR